MSSTTGERVKIGLRSRGSWRRVGDPLRHQILGGKKAIQFTLQGFPTLPEGAPAGNSGSLAVHKTAQSSYRHVSPLQATCFLFALAFSLVQIAQ